MKIQFLSIALILLLFLPLASEANSNSEEQALNKRKMDDFTARFKAESGFEGNIEIDSSNMNLKGLTGTFKDIKVSAPDDTTYMQRVFEDVKNKLLPYLYARDEQLSKTMLYVSHGRKGVHYKQMVNGIEIEDGGILKISYSTSQDRFYIVSSLVDVTQEQILPVITESDAINIYNQIVGDDELLKLNQKFKPKFRLRLCNVNKYSEDSSPDYKLCWVGGFSSQLVIDAINGTIYSNRLLQIKYHSVNLHGKTLRFSDNTGNTRYA